MQVLKNKYFIGIVILLSLLALIDWVLFGRTPVNEFHAVKSVVNNTLTPQSNNSTEKVSSTGLTASGTAVEKNGSQNFEPAKADTEQFKNWLKDESQTMLQYNVNAEALTQKYQALTAKMTTEQFKTLADVVRSTEQNANVKILAAYMLGYAGYDSIQTLADVAGSAYKLSGEVSAHSVAEAEQTRERAMRVIAIDRLYALANGDDKIESDKAKLELKKLISTIRDSYLKNYAQSKLNELSK